jgi:hypothetical protein
MNGEPRPTGADQQDPQASGSKSPPSGRMCARMGHRGAGAIAANGCDPDRSLSLDRDIGFRLGSVRKIHAWRGMADADECLPNGFRGISAADQRRPLSRYPGVPLSAIDPGPKSPRLRVRARTVAGRSTERTTECGLRKLDGHPDRHRPQHPPAAARKRRLRRVVRSDVWSLELSPYSVTVSVDMVWAEAASASCAGGECALVRNCPERGGAPRARRVPLSERSPRSAAGPGSSAGPQSRH